MAWRIEWSGGNAKGLAPVGWRQVGTVEQAREVALAVLRQDGGLDLRVVLVSNLEGRDVDHHAVAPSIATLTAWRSMSALPEPSRNAVAARRLASAEARCAAVTKLRAVLDQVVDDGDISRLEAARVVAALEAAMIRSASAAAA